MEQINDESDSERDEESYYLRSKRRRLDGVGSRGRVDDAAATTSTGAAALPATQPREPPPRKRKNPLLHMPTEILQRILHFVSYNDLSCRVRLVNRRFKVLAEDILNRNYKRIEPKLRALIKSTLDAIQSSQDDLEVRCLCKLLNFLEIVLFQHSILMSTIWRYVYNGYYRTFRCSMYGGKLLDAYDAFIDKFLRNPRKLYAPALVRDYNLPPEVTSIIELTKSFCLHFEKVSEEPCDQNMFHCGSKILDLLNCASFASKDTLYERSSANVFIGKYIYYFSNSWFVAMSIAGEKQMLWNQTQRLMHMRLRRIVLAHTEMCLHQSHFERERMLRQDTLVLPRKPGNSVYTGYGDVYDTFFYYGVMNEGAYAQKFHTDDGDNGDDMMDEDDEIFHEAEERNRNEDIEEAIAYRIPYLGTRMEVAVKCPLSHAPLHYLLAHDMPTEESPLLSPDRPQPSNLTFDDDERAEEDDLEWSSDSSDDCQASTSVSKRRKKKRKQKIRLEMNFECYGASYPRLPVQYVYSVKHERTL